MVMKTSRTFVVYSPFFVVSSDINGIKCKGALCSRMAWEYLVVDLKNRGRTVFENGIMVKSHTKKKDLSKLPQDLSNEKGRTMMEEAKGSILNQYGGANLEVVGTHLDLKVPKAGAISSGWALRVFCLNPIHGSL